MGNCGSAAQVISDIWEKFGDELMVFGCHASVALSESENPAVNELDCLEQANKTDDVSRGMLRFWNEMADNSWAAIGPRRLEFDVRNKGALVGTGGRIFISPIPVLGDQVTIKVRKHGGRGKASVTACKVAPNGQKTELWDTTFSSGKKNIGDHKSKTLRGVHGYLLQIHLDGKSFSNRFEYTLEASTVPESGLFTIQQKSSGRFLDAHQTADNDFSAVTRRAQHNETQQWILTRVDNAYTIQQKNSGRFLDAHQTADNDFSVVTRRAQDNETQQWLLTHLGNAYTIQQKSSGRFLDAHQTADNDFSVVTRDDQNNETQKWIIKPV